MIEETLTQYTQLPSSQISRLRKMRQSAIYDDEQYQTWIEQLDKELLERTLPHARAAYEKHLPPFTEHLRTHYGLEETPMSAFTLGNWLVGFLQYPDTITKLPKLHTRIPQNAFVEMLPGMIAMLDEMPEGRSEWQKALAIMALPLTVSA